MSREEGAQAPGTFVGLSGFGTGSRRPGHTARDGNIVFFAIRGEAERDAHGYRGYLKVSQRERCGALDVYGEIGKRALV